jgi:hypothetical protein
LFSCEYIGLFRSAHAFKSEYLEINRVSGRSFDPSSIKDNDQINLCGHGNNEKGFLASKIWNNKFITQDSFLNVNNFMLLDFSCTNRHFKNLVRANKNVVLIDHDHYETNFFDSALFVYGFYFGISLNMSPKESHELGKLSLSLWSKRYYRYVYND